MQTNEWLTPKFILEALGPFDLDPCASELRPFPTALEHVTVEHNGLARDWHGRVWLNPPYSHIGKWMQRMAEHDRGTALVFARTETRWWHEHVWPRATAVFFLRGRLTFIRADGRPHRRRGSGNAGAPSALIAYGPDDAARLEAVSIAGALVGRARTT